MTLDLTAVDGPNEKIFVCAGVHGAGLGSPSR